MPKSPNAMKANETYGKDNYREGGFESETYPGDANGSGMVVIGKVYKDGEPFSAGNIFPGDGGAFFRDISIFNASDAITNYLRRNYGATVSKTGARTDFQFRSNSGSALGISNTVAIRQALHLTGFQRHNDAWKYSTKNEIDELFGAEKAKWS